MNVLKMKPSVRPKRPRPHIVITGENLAKAKRGPRERGFLAASHVLGSLVIVQPTIRLAARIFKVSVPTVAAAVAELEATTVTVSSTSFLDEDGAEIEQSATPARACLAGPRLHEMWGLFDRFTTSDSSAA